jgi:hypothetical protein
MVATGLAAVAVTGSVSETAAPSLAITVVVAPPESRGAEIVMPVAGNGSALSWLASTAALRAAVAKAEAT